MVSVVEANRQPSVQVMLMMPAAAGVNVAPLNAPGGVSSLREAVQRTCPVTLAPAFVVTENVPGASVICDGFCGATISDVAPAMHITVPPPVPLTPPPVPLVPPPAPPPALEPPAPP